MLLVTEKEKLGLFSAKSSGIPKYYRNSSNFPINSISVEFHNSIFLISEQLNTCKCTSFFKRELIFFCRIGELEPNRSTGHYKQARYNRRT